MTDETSDFVEDLTEDDVLRWASKRGLTVQFAIEGWLPFFEPQNEPVLVYLPGDGTAWRFSDYQLPLVDDWPPIMRAVAQTRLRAIADHIGMTPEEADRAS